MARDWARLLRRGRRVALWTAGALIIGYLGVVGLFLWDFREIRVSVPRTVGGMVSETEAVETTRRALLMSGRTADTVRPVPFRHNAPELFARNTLDPTSGYVLWVQPSSTGLWGFMVRCDWRDSVAHCGVSKAH